MKTDLTKQNKTLLHLSLISGIGPATVEKLVAGFSLETVADIYQFSESDFSARCGVSQRVAHLIVAGLKDQRRLDFELELMQLHDITCLTIADEAYPALLKQIHLPPIVLYVRGILPAARTKSLAVVGSRKANAYAHRVTRLLLPPLIQHNVCIVSGGALGADAIAHSVTLENNGTTVAVLGAGLLRAYPRQNNGLFKSIVENGGALISPFPLETEATPGNFPARNRIIAGLSQVCLVLQAAEKSGALITASWALDAGRDVCAVPGPIDDPLSAGCNNLLRQGAHVITGPQDLLHLFGLAVTSERAQQQSLITESAPVFEDEIEATIYRRCAQPIGFDDLLAELELDHCVLQEKLFKLQLDGKLEQNFMGFWKALP